MIAHISSGYGAGTGDISIDTEVLIVGACDSGTAATVIEAMPETAIVYEACTDGTMEDYTDWSEDEWPGYGIPPKAILPRKSAPRITNHIIKQPGPMRRGNRT